MNITKVYQGKKGCMCGCRGRYSEKPFVFNRVLKIMEQADFVETSIGEKEKTFEDQEKWAYFEITFLGETKVYCIYYK